MTLHALALEFTLLLAVWLMLTVAQREASTPGRLTFVALALASATWCFGELLQLREAVDEIVADRIRYAGILALGPLFLGLAAHAGRVDVARRLPWFSVALMVPLACLWLLLFSDRWGALFTTTVVGGTDLHGPLWKLGAAYGYGLVVAGTALLLAVAYRTRRPGEWWRQVIAGLAPLLPLIANAAYLADESRGLSGRWGLDPTPVLLGVTLLALRGAVFTGGLMQVLSVSQRDLLDLLPFGVILTDRRGMLLDVNPAAARALGVDQRALLGRSLMAVLDAADGDLEVDVAPVLSAGYETGQLVVLGARKSPE